MPNLLQRNSFFFTSLVLLAVVAGLIYYNPWAEEPIKVSYQSDTGSIRIVDPEFQASSQSQPETGESAETAKQTKKNPQLAALKVQLESELKTLKPNANTERMDSLIAETDALIAQTNQQLRAQGIEVVAAANTSSTVDDSGRADIPIDLRLAELQSRLSALQSQ